MAISAQFVADFAGFKAAVDSADTKLKGFQAGAAQVERQLTRVGDAFSGRKILQEATLATKAVTDIGGVTKLTATEQARLNATVTEAIAKYNALGQQAPADLQKIQRETTQQAGIFERISATLGPLGTALTAAFSVTAVVGFGKTLLADADALVKLSDKTGISLQGLQKFQAAGDDAGNSLDQVTTAISKLQVNLADTTPAKDFTDQLAKMGLSISQLRALDPEGQFIAISDAIRAIPDPADRARAAVVLFGRAGAEVLPTLTRGFDDLEGSVVGMSDETVRALDKAGDALTAWGRIAKGVAAEVIVDFAKMLADTSSGLHRQLDLEVETAAQLQALLAKRQAAISGILLGGASQQAAPLSAEFAQASEQIITNQIAAQQEAAREAERINAQRNEAEARWIRISVEQNNAWADAVTSIEKNMLDERRSLEDRFYANEESKAVATEKRQLDAFVTDVDRMNDEIQSALKVASAGKVAQTFGQTILENLGQLRKTVPRIITDAFTGGGGLGGALKAIGVQLANAFLEPFIDSLIKGLASGALKRAFAGVFGAAALGGGATAAASTAAAATAGGATAGATAGGLGSSIAAFATNPITLGIAAGIGGVLLLRHFLGDREEKTVNDLRDQFFGQFQSRYGGDQAGSLAKAFGAAHISASVADASIRQLFAVKTLDAFHASEGSIISRLKVGGVTGLKSYQDGGFVPPGVTQLAVLHGGQFGETITPGSAPRMQHTEIHFHISTPDAEGFNRIFDREIAPRVRMELLTNRLGLVTNINRIVAKR